MKLDYKAECSRTNLESFSRKYFSTNPQQRMRQLSAAAEQI